MKPCVGKRCNPGNRDIQTAKRVPVETTTEANATDCQSTHKPLLNDLYSKTAQIHSHNIATKACGDDCPARTERTNRVVPTLWVCS